MLAVEKRQATIEEYFEVEANSPLKHEFIDGQIYAMAGGSSRHAALVFNACVALGNALRGKPCRGTSGEQRIQVAKNEKYTYPDAAVFYPDARFEKSKIGETLLDPKVIVEILSPSTGEYDRYGKFELYKKIESFTDYLLVAQDFVRVEHFHRGSEGWTVQTFYRREEDIRLESVDATLPLAEMYEDIDVPDGVWLLEPPQPNTTED